jgi:hypothetical protein
MVRSNRPARVPKKLSLRDGGRNDRMIAGVAARTRATRPPMKRPRPKKMRVIAAA